MQPSDETTMFSTLNLCKRFDDTTAVDDLSIEARKGEIIGLLGPNGAGKTTTIRMLSCLIAPTSGEASVCGYRVGVEDGAIRSRIGLLTETPGLWKSLTAEQNLTIYGRLYDAPNVAESVNKYLSMLGLWERRDDPVGTYSKGMRQKLALARALVHEPELLFLDEPTSGLDPKMTKHVREFIAELRHQGRTIVLCTHNLGEAEHLCDRIAIVRTRLVALDHTEVLRGRLFGRSTEIKLRRLDPDLIDHVRSLKCVSAARAEGQTLIIDLADPEHNNPELIRNLVSHDAEIISVSERERSLEEVYLALINESEAGQ
jgi:ABC-2 type transport system ATP-binding protein